MDTRCPNCGAKLSPLLVSAIKDPSQPESCYEASNSGILNKAYQY